MFKTLFGRMIFIFLITLLICIFISGSILYFTFGKLVTQQKEDKMFQGAILVNSAYNQFVNSIISESSNTEVMNRDVLIARKNLEYYIDYMSVLTDSFIWLVDEEGTILLASDIMDDVVPLLNNTKIGYQLPEKKQYDISVFLGGTDRTVEMGDFYGLFKSSGINYMTMRIPFEYNSDEYNSEIMGSIVVHTPAPEVTKMRESVVRLFSISAIIAFAISSVFIYFLSIRIVNPIKEMSHASKVISNGDFKARLHVKGTDEIAQLAHSFNNMVESLEQLEQMRKEFIANVSHELRTPMTTIKGFVQGIMDGTVPENKHNYYLDIVKNEIERLNRLINELLDLARLEGGELKLINRRFDINELIRICVISMETLITEKNLDFRAEFEYEKIFVYADFDSIQRVIINLLHNAIKFTPQSGTINVKTTINKLKCSVFVMDTGSGIKKGDEKFIFDRFHKADKSRGNDKTGTGLGLSIVKNIIKAHHQEIRVSNNEDKGACFCFTLDAYEEAYIEN